MGAFRVLSEWLAPVRQPKSSRRWRGRQPVHAENLEQRVLLYSASGNSWPNKQLITISFVPDGTNLGGVTSNLQATFDTKFGSAATWQNQILKAAQYWAQQTNINFAVVSDNGGDAGSGDFQQGDPNFGDIRIGGFNFGNSNLAQAYMPPPVNNYSIAGDIQINTGKTFKVGSQYDLFTVMVHEFGHALGLSHATSTSACMYATYNGVDSALNSDDISGITAIYSAGAARSADTQESNNSTSAAKTVTLDATTKAAVVNNLDLTTSTDLDYFKIVVPSGATTTLKATVATSGLSLMSPKVEIVVGSTTKATGAAGATEYGVNKTATYTSATDLAAGKTVYIKVSSANSLAAFKTGKYALILNMGTGADPAYTKYGVMSAKETTLSSGGGVAYKMGTETLGNTANATVQQTSDRAVAIAGTGASLVVWESLNQDGSDLGVYVQRYDINGNKVGSEVRANTVTLDDQFEPTVAMDALGNSVVVWTSEDQDGSLGGIFAQRFDLLGNKLGSEFRVNTTTSGHQSSPAVAMDAAGNFVVTWTSAGQDGSGSGIYAQRYSFLGLAVGSEFRVNGTTAGDQTDSSIAMNRLTGDFVVAWTSAGQDGSGAGVYAQRFSSSGSATGSEFRVNTTTTNDQNEASVAVNRLTGDFIVTWTSAGQDGSGKGIYGQRYNYSGVAQGTQILVNTATTGDQSKSSVAIDAGGEYYVTWQDAGVAANGLQIYGQQLEKNGNKKEAAFVVNATTAGDQKNASIGIDLGGRVVVVWSGNGTGDSGGVFLQRYGIDLHPFSAEEHGHSHTADQTPAATRQQLQHDRRSGGKLSQAAALSGIPQQLRERFEARRRELQAEARPAQGEVHVARAAESREFGDLFPAAIDSLFGSADWLAGRHYRGVNARA